MLTTKITSMLAVFALVAPAALHAQEDTLVAAGDRVRVWTTLQAGDPLTGSIESVTSDSLVLDLEGGGQSVALARSEVGKLEVSQGTTHYTALGAVLGLGAGVAIAAAAMPDNDPCSVLQSCFLDDLGTGIGLMVAGIFGGLTIGALIGSAIASERWEEVPVGEIRVSPSQHAADGISVSASIRW